MSYDFFKGGSLRPLRPHQARAIEALRSSIAAGHRRPMLQAPTGFGKTLTAAHIIKRALDRGHSVIFTVPALSLGEQTVAAFEAEGLHSIGVMRGYHHRTDPSQPLQVASIQTLARRQKPKATLVIIDEAHLSFDAVHKWMADPDWRKVPFIGMSATPWTRGLGNHYDDLIIAARTSDLIAEGYLSRFVVFAPSEPDLDDVKTVAGDFDEGQLAETCNKVELIGDVVETWWRLGENRPTLCYGVDRAHALHLKQRFDEAGVPSEYIDAHTDRTERERIFARFSAGDVRIICNVGTLVVGIDLDVRCLIDARPTKSEMKFVQTIGRGLRTAEGKDRLIILDHAGNHLRLGTVLQIHHDRLDTDDKRSAGHTERTNREILPRRCETCSALLPAGAFKCAECGAIRESKSATTSADGELVRLGDRSTRRAPSLTERAEFFGELKHIGKESGYQPGWATYKFRERFGCWPNEPSVKWALPQLPSLKTKQWVLSRRIAFAKARANG